MIDDYGKRPGFDGTMARLTRRECDILAASARGAGADGVAHELGLPEQEVRVGLASAIRKLGARSKLEAVIITLRRGDIDLRPPG
jgi:DNA-binding NarL/FixJ family response regulator